MIIYTISHEEATIRHFMEYPSYARLYLQMVLADGDVEEIREVKGWISEARARLRKREAMLEVVIG